MNGNYYQIHATSPGNYEPSDPFPILAPDEEWKLIHSEDTASQIIETTKPLDGTDFLQVVTFYQRLRVFEYHPIQVMNLYAEAKGSTVKAVLAPNTSFQYKLLSRNEIRMHILIRVTTDQTIPAKTGLVTPEKPSDIKNATFGEAKIPIYIVARDPSHPGWGWIDGYIDN